MKIGTDGVLLGAWTNPEKAELILDIGTGTGLLSLMQAQKSTAEINAIEIDLEAVYQAKENLKNSPWAKRISLWNTSIQTYAYMTEDPFDLIISNPPFFNSEKSETSREVARHQGKLTFEELLRDTATLLRDDGRFCVIIPAESEEQFTSLAAQMNLHKNKICKVYGNPKVNCKRVMLEYSKTKQELIEGSLIIEKNERHDYTSEYLALVKDYMLFA
jgi:tRNA1Val (adenine37-N6)-methyltransferase